MIEAAILKCERGSVEAPAGCGKTDLIVRTVRQDARELPVLILTHTHAGVKALSDRLKKYEVKRSKAQVETIAGWCLRFGLAFPKTAKLESAEPIKSQWASVYDGALRLLQVSAIKSVVEASYGLILVDEYQDCNSSQHKVMVALSEIVPTCVLGDPLQGIFRFAGQTVAWSEVTSVFPSLGKLSEPWRWQGKNPDLGDWLLSLRKPLIEGKEIDLSAGPFEWKQATTENQRLSAGILVQRGGTAVAVRKWPRDAHEFAKTLDGTYGSMEEIDCNDLLIFMERLDSLTGVPRAACVLEFATQCMTAVGEYLGEVITVLNGNNLPDLANFKEFSNIVSSLVEVAATNENSAVTKVLLNTKDLDGAKLFRRELFEEALRTIVEFSNGGHESLVKTAWVVRNRHRTNGRSVEKRSVSKLLSVDAT